MPVMIEQFGACEAVDRTDVSSMIMIIIIIQGRPYSLLVIWNKKCADIVAAAPQSSFI
jgi:hypothetical protein